MSIEGKAASWVGWEDAGHRIGDRCRVVDDSGTSCHVQWSSGARVGDIELVATASLVIDQPKSAWDDEFAFEASHRESVIPTGRLIERGGISTAAKAVVGSDLFADARAIVSEAVHDVMAILRSSAAWQETLATAGDESDELARQAIALLFAQAQEGA